MFDVKASSASTFSNLLDLRIKKKPQISLELLFEEYLNYHRITRLKASIKED